jgi:hypothetical protein
MSKMAQKNKRRIRGMKKVIMLLAAVITVSLEARFLLFKDGITEAQREALLSAHHRISKDVENLQDRLDKKEVAEQVANYIEQVKSGVIPTSKNTLEKIILHLQSVLMPEIIAISELQREVEAAENS